MPNAVEFHSSIATNWSELYKKGSFSHRLKTFHRLIGDAQGQRWLDAGCGAGNIGAMCDGAQVTFLDASPEMISVCKEKFPGSTCIVAPITSTTLPDTHFDGIICSSVIEYIRFSGGVFRECHRLLKPGGRLLISAPSRSPIRAALKMSHALTGKPKWIEHSVRAFTRQQFIELISINKFEVRGISHTGASIAGCFWTLMVADARKD